MVGEVDLEAGDARERAGRSADLGGEVGEGRQIVAEQGRLARETVTRELHPTRVARADDDAVELLDGFRHALVVAQGPNGRTGRAELAAGRATESPQALPEAKSRPGRPRHASR